MKPPPLGRHYSSWVVLLSCSLLFQPEATGDNINVSDFLFSSPVLLPLWFLCLDLNQDLLLLLSRIDNVAEALLLSQLQIFLEKYGYLHKHKHAHDADEMLSAIRWA